MTTRMLIDARHREETRVAVVSGNRVEEFDFESAERKQLKGNIYLAKVTRVEPSLQAAFIDYGGNRHGFLAFSEIHPDYYQIPREDREALLREEAEHAAEEERLRAQHDSDDDDDTHDEGFAGDDREDDGVETVGDGASRDDEGEHDDGEEGEGPAPAKPAGSGDDGAVEALRQRRMNLRRRYKIQDVIRRRQVLLVQVVKEERGNKGAALTTYLSLAGRYCVLMPNTSHGGGISRKISNAGDRKRLKSIMADLSLPPSMGCIVRTAGLQRTRTEIKRDFDYLARLWDGIRENTLSSAAPALIYGDNDLLKRAIRDIYNKDIDEVIVEGEDGYRQAKDYMRLLMPSHAARVKHYSDPIPLYQRAHVEDQLAAMYHPVVQLKSGGYLVINPTEALVSIDVNSGRSTREHNIEQTATATNLEAAQEIARQLRLRDMAGLVVIDFIDMDNGSNVRKIEKAMKEALKNDRARIQVGRMSSFGLMEMSRQRLRTGVLEASTRGCPHCEGTGLVRTASSAGLSALRLLEDEAARGRGALLTLRASQEAAFYVLNRKRADIAEIEDRYGVQVEILPDGEQEGARMSVEASGPPPAHAPRFDRPIEEVEDELPAEIEEEEEEAAEEDERAPSQERGAAPRGEEGERGGRRRRRRRHRGGRESGESVQGTAETGEFSEASIDDQADEPGEAEIGETAPVSALETGEPGEGRRRRGRRGRRGGRRDGREGEPMTASEGGLNDAGAEDEQDAVSPVAAPESDTAAPEFSGNDEQPGGADAVASAEEPGAVAPRTRRRPGARAPQPVEAPVEADEGTPKPRRSRRKRVAEEAEPTQATEAVSMTEAPEREASETRPAPRRRPRRADVPAVTLPESQPAAIAPSDTADGAAPAEDAPAPGEEPALAIAATEGSTDETSAEDAAANTDAGTNEPPRRGWWQRTFGA